MKRKIEGILTAIGKKKKKKKREGKKGVVWSITKA